MLSFTLSCGKRQMSSLSRSYTSMILHHSKSVGHFFHTISLLSKLL